MVSRKIKVIHITTAFTQTGGVAALRQIDNPCSCPLVILLLIINKVK